MWSAVVVTKFFRFSIYFSFIITLSFKQNGTRIGVADSYCIKKSREPAMCMCAMEIKVPLLIMFQRIPFLIFFYVL